MSVDQWLHDFVERRAARVSGITLVQPRLPLVISCLLPDVAMESPYDLVLYLEGIWTQYLSLIHI